MQTLTFLPERLNQEPVVFRGFTTPELGLGALLGAVLGLIVSLPLSLLFGWVMIPTAVLLMPLLVIAFGGMVLSRIKRGKPAHYLAQRMALKRQLMGIGKCQFILISRVWSLRRTLKEGV